MIIYYSGAEKTNSVQDKPEKSLGGFKSSTKILPQKFSQMFSDTTDMVRHLMETDTKCFYLENDSQYYLKDLKISVLINNEMFAGIKFGFQEPYTENGEIYVDSISSKSELPNDVEFYEMDSYKPYAFLKFATMPSYGEVMIINIGSEDFIAEPIDFYEITVENIAKHLIKTFRNTDYEVSGVSTNDDDVIDSIKFVLNKGTNFQEEIFVSSFNGSVQCYNTKFSGGLDNSKILLEYMKPKQVLAIWIQRFVKNDSISCDKIYDSYQKKQEVFDSLQIQFSATEDEYYQYNIEEPC